MKHYQRLTMFIWFLLLIWIGNICFDMMNEANTVENYTAYIIIVIVLYISGVSKFGYNWITWLVNKIKNKQKTIKIMKKLLLSTLILGTVLLTSCTTVPPGSVGIVVHNFGDNKGVDNVATTT